MPKYLFSSNYTPEAVAKVREAGYASRVEPLNALATSLGGTLEGVWFTTGGWTIHAVFDLPSQAAAFSLGSYGWATGAQQRSAVQPLFTAEEADAAIAAKVDYTPPGS